jgi:hypothetical protein
MSTTNWFGYLCLQAILFTVVIESWIHAQASCEVLAKPILYNVEEVNTMNVGISDLDSGEQSRYNDLSKYSINLKL